MQQTPRSVRMLVYRLKDVEEALRKAKIAGAADDIARAAKLFGSSAVEVFLDESRLLLVNVLLGERDLPAEIMGEVLDVVALIDDAFVSLKGAE